MDIYINLFTLLYADDTVLLSQSKDDLQRALTALYDYCQKWQLTVNTDKTRVVVFSRGKVRKSHSWKFGPNEIEAQEEYTYHYNGHFAKAIAKQVSQAKRAMYGMMAKIRQLGLPVDIQCHLFDSCVLPILLYGTEVWGFSDLKQIEVFHNHFCKHMLHLNKNTANCITLGELGRHGVDIFVKQCMLNYWARIVNGKQSKIAYITYRLFRNMYDNGHFNSKWFAHISSSLDNLGLSYLWQEETFNPNWFKHKIRST